MRFVAILTFLLCLVGDFSMDVLSINNERRPLTEEEKRVIIGKGTERPFSGEYYNNKEKGLYVCRNCGFPLYRSDDKFDSQCGWPSFDEEIKGAIKKETDKDGQRIEIQCNNCFGHLGHVFYNEGFTKNMVRHCVNSISMEFIPDHPESALQRTYFAAGCFWGPEYYFMKQKGVIVSTVGYMGGDVDYPTYHQVSTGKTGHAETVEVIFDPSVISFEDLCKLFFEIHDFSQKNRQGPDIGEQYRSAIFYVHDAQKEVAVRLKNELEAKGYKVVTSIEKAKSFWVGEDYHQEYYEKKKKVPYCHSHKKIFNE